MIRIAVVDDEDTACRMMARILRQAGYEVQSFGSGLEFLALLDEQPPDILFLDLQLPEMDGMEVLSRVKEGHPETEVVIVTGHGSIETAVEATQKGAFHYLTKPIRGHDLRLMAERAAQHIRLRRENLRLRLQLDGDTLIPGFIGRSRLMQEVFTTIAKVAQVHCNVLIEAETGTGKQLTARAIHELGPRRDGPFVYFNCGGFTEDLVCNELFGHERGAFTGADRCQKGLLESAAGGTVLLDEIGEMDLSMQVKLLHVLQERRLIRVGGTRPIDLDIRIIAATNRNLQELVDRGAFREDLYYRLNVVTIRLPTLRQRREDIPLLARHFLDKANAAFGKQVRDISQPVLDLLMRYDFPGNVRELENIIQRGVALTEHDMLRLEDLPSHLRGMQLPQTEGAELPPMREVERRYIAQVLERTGHNIKAASRILDIPRTTLWRKLKKYNLDKAGRDR